MKHNARQVQTFIGATVLAAIGSAGYACLTSHLLHPQYALALLALAAVTSRMKIKLPGIDGNMSVNMPFLLLALANLSAAEAVLIACASTVVQTWPKPEGKFRPEQMLFNVSMMASAASLASSIWNAALLRNAAWAFEPLMLVSATAVFFLGQTSLVAGILKLAEGAAMRRIWWSIAQLAFPYYVASAGLTSMVNVVTRHIGWQLVLAALPVMYGIYRSYRVYFERATELAAAPALVSVAKAGV
jgi:hypothetical protein